jgi:hypothetical protein
MASPVGPVDTVVTTFLERAQAVKTFLDHVRSSLNFVNHARTQHLSLKSLLLALSAIAAAANSTEICNRIVECAFPTDLEADLLFEARARAATSTQRRLLVQAYECFFAYLVQDRWNVLASTTESDHAKLNCILTLVVRLGLRNASERTFQVMTALWIMATRGVNALHSMDPHSLHESFKHVKIAFRQLVQNEDKPSVRCLHLPHDVDSFVSNYPTLAAGEFHEMMPILCPIPAQQLMQAANKVPMRKSCALLSTNVLDLQGSAGVNGNMARQVMAMLPMLKQMLSIEAPRLAEFRPPLAPS